MKDMKKNIFSNNVNLDLEFLETTYSDDLQAARTVFQDYLKTLDLYLHTLEESFNNKDIYRFRETVDKLKPEFTRVGLSDVSKKMHVIELKCIEGRDLVLNEIEIQQLISRIRISAEELKIILGRLN